MGSNIFASDQMRAAKSDAMEGFAPAPLHARRQDEIVEPVIFWLFVAGLAWVPFWYGSNDLLAWGINALLFPGLAVVYEISILVGRKGHPIGIANLAIPATLFAAVVAWILVQNLTLLQAPLAHPIWGMAADALERPVQASISVDRDLTTLALVRLLTAASVFWLAVQLARNAARADWLSRSIAMIGCAYAAFGLASFALKAGSPSGAFVSSTFVNRNSFATYAGIGLISTCGFLLRLYRHEVAASGAPLRLRLASFIEVTGQAGAALVGGAFLLLVALLLTGSRGGIIATAFGLFALAVLTFGRGRRRVVEQLGTILVGIVLVGVTLFAFGDIFLDSLIGRGIGDAGRVAVYLITMRSIMDAPLRGFGYGTFADVFPMYRDRSIAVQGTWEQAHNTYLEVFQGLGLVFGSMLVACVLLLVLRCVKGAATRHENVTIPQLAASAACLVGVHALVDFSLQIQAVALTFMALLGAGVAQSQSSRLALDDR
jgi:O-antigen ligase